MKQLKSIIITIASILGVFLVACGSDSGTGSGIAQAETVYGLGECEASNEGVVKLVTSENQYYKCVDGDWEVTEPPVQSSSSISSPFARSSNSNKSPLPESGVLKDSRDGQTYRTVKIGNQVWMAENLNFVTDNSWCYGEDPANCAKYGRLYTWAAAMDSVGEWSTNGKGCGYGKTCSVASDGSATLVRGICPKGWHLPSLDEWETLIVAVDGSITEYTFSNTAGTKLKSATGWNAYSGITNEDAFGFSALPAGNGCGNGFYLYEGDYAYFWSSTEYDSVNAYGMNLYYGDDKALLGEIWKGIGYSVRCLKD